MGLIKAVACILVGFGYCIFGCKPIASQEMEIRGIYGNPKPFWDQGIVLGDLGVNAIFVHSNAINSKMVSRAKEEGVKIFAEFATLNGKNYVEEHPEAWAIDKTGEPVEAASWFMGVCPTEPGFRAYRFNQLRELLQNFELDGVWMDYVHWHAQFEEASPILPETCFDHNCLKKYSDDTGIAIPNGTTAEKARWILQNHEDSWRSWRSRVIVEWVMEIRAIVEELRPGILLGLYHCPWTDDEFKEARRNILGLDYDLLAQVIDVFSPMVYHGRMERPPSWVEENIAWFSKRMNVIRTDQQIRIWPIVQAHNDPYVISGEEFETVLRAGLSGKSSGVMMFTSYAVAEDKEKIKVMKEVYQGR